MVVDVDDGRYRAVFGPSLEQQLDELRGRNMAAAKARSSDEKEILSADKNYESSASVHVCNSISFFKMEAFSVGFVTKI